MAHPSLAPMTILDSEKCRTWESAGQFTLNSANSTATFTLAFEYPTFQPNGFGTAQVSSWKLQYNGTTIQPAGTYIVEQT